MLFLRWHKHCGTVLNQHRPRPFLGGYARSDRYAGKTACSPVNLAPCLHGVDLSVRKHDSIRYQYQDIVGAWQDLYPHLPVVLRI